MTTKKTNDINVASSDSEHDSSTEADEDDDLGSRLEDLLRDDPVVWGMDFLREYQEVGDRYSHENEHLHIGLALALVSSAVGRSCFYKGDSKEHARVHPMIIQGSGTGKDPAFKLAKTVARGAGLQMKDLNEVTSAGLVGTIRDGDEVEGAAKQADIIGFREATQLFKSATQDHSSNLPENVNTIMDGSKIQKKLAEGTVEYTPNCVLVGTTYEPTDLPLEQLMQNGTLARFLYFFKPIDSDYRWKMGERVLEETIAPTDDAKAKERYERLTETINRVRQEFTEPQKFEFELDLDDLETDTLLREIYDDFDDITQEVVKPAVTRYHMRHVRISCLMAALDECSTTVTKKHTEWAVEIIRESWTNLLQFYSESVQGRPDQPTFTETGKKMILTLADEDGLTQKELADEIGVSPRTIRNNQVKLERVGLIEITKEGNTNIYSLRSE